MRRRLFPLSIGGLLGAAVGVLVPGRPAVVPTAATVGLLLLYFCLRAPLALLGYALFVSTLLTRARMPVVPLLPEQALVLLVVGGLLVRGRLDVVVRATRLLPRSAWLFVGWGLAVSVLRSPDVAASLRIVGWIGSSLLVASLVAVLCLRPETETTLIIGRLATLTALLALVGVLAWLAASVDPRSGFGVQTESLTGAPAAFGLAHEANIFGGICAIWLVLDVLYGHRPRLATSGLVRGLLGLGVLVSLTRAAALGAVIGVVVGALASRRRRRIGASVLLVGGLTVGALFLVGPTVPMLRPVVEKGTQLLDLESSTSVVRRQSWDLALGDLSLANVVIGNGVNSFGQRHADPSRPSDDVPGYLGTLYLQVLYDVGLIGTLLVCAAGITILKRRSSRDRRVLGVIACGAIVGAATSPLWFANWWVIVALAALTARRTESAGALLPHGPPLAQAASLR